jgi:ATP adenylyltransferase
VDDERLWAPWRYEYVAGNISAKDLPPTPQPTHWTTGCDQACFLCRAAAHYAFPRAADHANLVAWQREAIVVVLNRFPYSNGHLLIAPRRHVPSLDQLTPAEHLEIMDSLATLTDVLGRLIKAEGFNIGLNLGRVAGAGVPGHLHWHLVPRWLGDKNFMPITAGTQVIAQSLESLWELLTAELK